MLSQCFARPDRSCACVHDIEEEIVELLDVRLMLGSNSRRQLHGPAGITMSTEPLTIDKRHGFSVQVKWTGNRGTGTSHYRAYDRAHEISGIGKPAILASSDAAFRGDRTRYSP